METDVEIDGDYNEHNSRCSSQKSGNHNTGYNSQDFSPTEGYCDDKTSPVSRNSGYNSYNSGSNSPGASTSYQDYDEQWFTKKQYFEKQKPQEWQNLGQTIQIWFSSISKKKTVKN